MKNKIQVFLIGFILLISTLACVESGEVTVTPLATQRSGLHLLSSGLHTAVVYNEPDSQATPIVEEAFGQLVSAGMDGYEVNITWAELEDGSGQVDTDLLEHWLSELNNIGITAPYMVIKTLDTNQLALPADLISDSNPQKLADGLRLDSPEIIERFKGILAEVVPILKAHGGFYLSVGNEVDVYLRDHPDAVSHFAAFVRECVTFIHAEDPDMAVGVNMTWRALYDFNSAEAFISLSDAVSLSYYPLDHRSQGLPPEDVFTHLEKMLQMSQGKPILIQEAGYPSGVMEDHQALENQAKFIENLLAFAVDNPQFRFISIQHLSDWPEATCRYFEDYYGLHDDGFRNFLCSLGVITYGGQKKPAYARLLAAVDMIKGGAQ